MEQQQQQVEQPRAKRRKAAASADSSSPLALLRQALRLVRNQPCGDASADANIESKLQQAAARLADAVAGQPAVAHSLDLELSADEPGFVLASCHLQLGLLRQRQDRLEEAAQQLQRSLELFPSFVAAHSCLGQVLKACAGSAQQLADAEAHLRRALVLAVELQQREGGMLVSANAACAAELEAGEGARGPLAMLLCQLGRGGEAAEHLAALGYRYRLADGVLCYPLPGGAAAAAAAVAAAAEEGERDEQGSGDDGASASASTRGLLQVLDGALPAALLAHLQAVFAPAAPFWGAHGYGRVGYFSYMFRLDEPADSSSMHQLAHHLRSVAAPFFPAVAEARFAEFWAHCRRHSAGHQLHFDSDDEGQAGVRNPIISCVLYLSPNTSSGSAGAAAASDGNAATGGAPFVGGPTLMTDQRLGGPLASAGWLASPSENRAALFDGRFLHGVIPGRGPSPGGPGARRVTLMVAFWRELAVRTPAGSGRVGACMPMPDVSQAAGEQQWARALGPAPAGWGDDCAPLPLASPPPIARVWQPLSGLGSTSGAAYDACFQGF